MKLFLIILAVVAVGAAVVWIGTKFFGLTKGEDKDGIPDKVEDTAKEVKRRPKRVKELDALRKSWNAELVEPTFLGLIHKANRKKSYQHSYLLRV